MAVNSGKALVQLAMREPAQDAGEFAGRLVDYIADEAMLAAVESSLGDPSVNVYSMFTQEFDALFRSAMEGLDKINPGGAAYLRAGIRTFAAGGAFDAETQWPVKVRGMKPGGVSE